MLSLLSGSESVAEPAQLWFVALLGASVKGAVVVLCAAAAAFFLRRSSAATRHFIWTLAFAVLLVLPVFSVTLSHWDIPLLLHTTVLEDTRPYADAATGVMRTASLSVRSAGVPISTFQFDPSWLEIGFWIWLVGALLALATCLLGLRRLWWLGKRAQPITGGALLNVAERIRSDLGLHRSVRLLLSAEPVIPMTWGTARPVVLLPLAVTEWPSARREAVLRHEFAHVKRYDCTIQLATELVCALYWFNPLVWIAASRLRVEREHACDDHVLRSGTTASDYDHQLLEVTRALRVRGTAPLAAIGMIRRSQVSERLIAVLDEGRCRGRVSRWQAILGASLAIAVVLFLATLTPGPRALVSAEPPVQPSFSGDNAPSREEELTGIPFGWWEETASVTEIKNEQEIPQVARMVTMSKPEIEPAARRLRRLFDLPGTGLYLSFTRPAQPIKVVLVPLSDDSRRVTMPFGKITLSSGPEEVDAEVPPVAVFWVNKGAQQAYTFHVPITVTYVTVMVDGRVIAAAQPVQRTGPTTFRANE